MTEAPRIGPYVIERELGCGGMGTVYRAASSDGRIVALKVVHDHIAATPGFVDRFVREGELGRAIRHPNVVATLATGQSDGRHWIALEFVEGRTLVALRQDLGTVPEQLCRHVAAEIAKGLAALHAAGLVHRDVKPENVLVTRDHTVKVMDLGIARSVGDHTRMTATGVFVGSVQYAAPEQFAAAGRALDGRADLWALGVTLYEIATGHHPFEGRDVPETLHNVLHTVPRRAGEVNPQLSPFFEEVLRCLLEKDRDRRFPRADELSRVIAAGESSEWWRERSGALRAATRRPLRRVRIPRETSIHGRDAELEALAGAFAKAAASEGGVVLVEGEAGIGKSRLVDEFVATLERDGCDLNFLWGSYPPGGAATASGAFATAWREFFGASETTLRSALPEQPALVPAFAALLRGDAPPAGSEPLSRDAIQTVFVRSAQTLASERPTIVLVEDLHFAPDEGRALFASLALAAPGHRILLVGTTRPGLDEKWVAALARGGASRIAVRRIGAADLVHLLGETLRSLDLAEELAGKIAVKSDGNPFFVFEILRGLREGLFLTQRSDGSWSTTRRVEELSIPPSIADLIQARVSDLGDEDRNLLEVAACAGFEFDPGLVGAALGVPPIPLLQRLGLIEKRARLVRACGRSYVFDHHQVQEHLYGGIHEQLREQYHAAIGDALERRSGAAGAEPNDVDGETCVALAEHFLKGRLPDRALRFAEAAVNHLLAGSRAAAAARIAAAILDEPRLLDGERRGRMAVRLSECHERAGDAAAERTALMHALEVATLIGSRELEITARVNLGWNGYRTGGGAAEVPSLERAIEIAVETSDLRGEGAAHGNLSSVLYGTGRVAEARAHSEQSYEIALRRGDRRRAATAACNLASICWSLGDRPSAWTWIERARELAEGLNESTLSANIVGTLGNLHYLVGDWERSIAHATEQLRIGRATGNRRAEAFAAGNTGNALWARGCGDEALVRIGTFARLARELGDRRAESLGRGNAANIERALGRADLALPEHEAARAIARDIGDLWVESEWIRQCAEDLAELDTLDQASSLAKEALATARSSRVKETLVNCLMTAGQIATLRGEGAAVESFREAREVADGVGDEVNRLAAEVCMLEDDGDARVAASLLDPLEARIGLVDRVFLRKRLFDAGAGVDQLRRARDGVEELVSRNAPDRRAALLANVRMNREVIAACERHGIAPRSRA